MIKNVLILSKKEYESGAYPISELQVANFCIVVGKKLEIIKNRYSSKKPKIITLKNLIALFNECLNE